LLAVLAGFLFSFLVPLHTYKDQGDGSLFLASKFDKEVLEQTFSPIKLSNRDVENPSKPYLPNKKIYIFYKLGCPYCRAGITKVLSQLKDQQKEKVEILKEENVTLEAWAPFAEGRNNIFSNPVLEKIAKKHNKSVAQVIIRYFVEQNIVVLAKTTKQERMKENLNVFDFTLDLTDKEEIAALDLKESQFIDHTSPERIRKMAKYKLNLE